MDTLTQKLSARQFVERWQAEEGNEDSQSRSFWIEFAHDLMGIANPTHVLDFERKVKGRKIDVFFEDMGVLIEQKSRGVDLDKKSERSKKAGEETPYQQAKWYADNLPNSVRPNWIIVCNFDEFRIHSLDSDDPEHDFETVTLKELPDQLHMFGFLTDKSASRLVKEKELSVKTGEIVGRLYKSLSQQYKNIETDKHEQRSLNILIVRFVFLLYAEDAGILQEHQAFLKYLKNIEPEDMRGALIQLFEVLDTPEDKRDPYLGDKLLAFPYINGSLFSHVDIIIPQFTPQIKFDLLKEASQEFDWSGISPTIFGATFESTLNPDTRREGGMHYTSIENIHKVIDPLFLDDLRLELAEIEGEKVEKRRIALLKQFQKKLASIKILDPACGSGNFLTESYLSLRRLENRVLENLMGAQMGLGFSDDASPIAVSIDQFFGIEINDFAVAVAKTALWIAEEQMMDVTQDILIMALDFLPLSSNNNIHEGNALRMDWNEVLPASECSYIIGNPPFLGHQWRTKEQQADMDEIFDGVHGYGKLDYVCAWYEKAARYIRNSSICCSFVSTNSICQGESVGVLWRHLASLNIEIDYAYTTFVWNSEATDQAHVHVVIIGFSNKGSTTTAKRLFDDKTAEPHKVAHINGYLSAAPDVFIENRGKPLNVGYPEMTKGSQPTDGGGLLLDGEDRKKLLLKYPHYDEIIRPYVGGREFLNGGDRWCLWLVNADLQRFDTPELRERLEIVRASRLKSPTRAVVEAANTPHLFTQIRQPSSAYLAVPEVSSGRRKYIPIGYLGPEIIASNQLRFIPTDSLFVFGLLSSQMHAAWMRIVGGRLKSDYRYSPAVYNSFIFPRSDSPKTMQLTRCAQAVLDAREQHPDKSLADLYDPDKMPADLLAAHKALDRTVEQAYGVDFNGDEEKIVAHLFKLYASATTP